MADQKTKDNLTIRIHPSTLKSLDNNVVEKSLRDGTSKFVSTFIREELIKPYVSIKEHTGRSISLKDLEGYVIEHIHEIENYIRNNKNSLSSFAKV